MYLAAERLPHLLKPAAYWSAEQYSRESAVFSATWHLVGLTSELSRPGDFITTEIADVPVQVRNFEGQIHAVSNVCAHRHCLLTSIRRGSSPRLDCQYHGWEYDASGSTRRIPAAQNFAPLTRGAVQLDKFRVATAGQLVFVNLSHDGDDLRTCLGESWDKICSGFGEGWQLMLSQQTPLTVNWKVPVENSLEAYHVPWIHPETFRADPGDSKSTHILEPRGSSFRTQLPFEANSAVDRWFQRAEGKFLRIFFGQVPTAIYEQHHLFPNFLCSFTDMISLVHVLRPTGPETCTSIIYQFGRTGKSLVVRCASRLWGFMAAQITRRILAEDFRLFPDIQRGLRGSNHPGMLGRCEERIHHFQAWLQGRFIGNARQDESESNNLTNQMASSCKSSHQNHQIPSDCRES